MVSRDRIQVLSSVESFVRKIVSRVILRPITPEIVALAGGVPQGSCRSRDWSRADNVRGTRA